MYRDTQAEIVDIYRSRLSEHGGGPGACGWSEEGQRFRLEKLLEIGDLSGHSVLDLGCGLGEMCTAIRRRFDDVAYTGVDILPDFVERATATHRGATFLRRDILGEPLDVVFDYVLMSGVFNDAVADCAGYLKKLSAAGFGLCRLGMAFNFLSTSARDTLPGLAYHDPTEVLAHCIGLSPTLTMHHHYERCDVAVFLRR